MRHLRQLCILITADLPPYNSGLVLCKGSKLAILGTFQILKNQTGQLVGRILWGRPRQSSTSTIFAYVSSLAELSSWQTPSDTSFPSSLSSALSEKGPCVQGMRCSDQHRHRGARLTKSSFNPMATSTPLLSIYIFNRWSAFSCCFNVFSCI